MLILASSQPPSPTDSYCPKRWSCPCSSLYHLWISPVCRANQLSCLTWPQTRQTKENHFFSRLVSLISLFLRASCRGELRLHGAGWGREKAMCGQKVTLPGGMDQLGRLSRSRAQSIPSWVSTKMQTQWSLSCRKTVLISFCLSHLFFSVGSLIFLWGIFFAFMQFC